MKVFFYLCLIFIPICCASALAPEAAGNKRTISGYLRDAKDGESLVGATVYVKDENHVSSSNQYGFYSISLLPGAYNIIYSYVGYKNIEKTITLKENVSLNLEMEEETQELQEVVIKSENAKSNIKRAEMSVEKLDIKAIRKIPALMGEVDVVKAIQLLPGVQTTSEGSSGFSVRGGNPDQNLILLDEATVYNASHLMGFFSIFNNDAVKDVKLYKGDIPAQYGGRLSSLLDVHMKEGNSKEMNITGGIGLLSSRLTIEGPIIKDQTSYIVSGRRTYYDIFFPLFNNKDLSNSSLYFYDLNAKINHQIDNNNRIFLSTYLGNDNFGFNKQFGFEFGNKTATLRWNHQYSPVLFSNVSLIASSYSYQMSIEGNSATSFVWQSNITDYGAKLDYSYYPNTSNTIKFGMSSVNHRISPGTVTPLGDSSLFNKYQIPNNYSLEHGIYVSNEQQIGTKLNVKYGLRVSIFQNIGNTVAYTYTNDYKVNDTVNYGNNQIYKTYYGWEPRLAAAYSLNDVSSLKASYSRTMQYMQLASNSTGGMPMDIWFSASPNIKPQIANQFAFGYFRNFMDHKLECSIETYYKKMDNAIDFVDFAQLLLNKQLEGQIRAGEAKSYGAEFMLQYTGSKLNGWISYTLSHTVRQIPGINNGKEYLAPYDKPNNINVVLNYDLTERLSVSATWVYASGLPVTLPVFTYEYDGIMQKGYTDRNSYRLPAYHRLDLSLTLKQKGKNFGLWEGEWVFGVYNAYNRHNTWMLNFVNDATPRYVESISILPILPSITYNFKF
jgi:hypothetical protein